MITTTPGIYSFPGVRDIHLGVCRSDIERGRAYFATAGSSAYFDPTAEGAKLYDLAGVHIADTSNPGTAVALLEEILRAAMFLPKQRPRIEAALKRALAGDSLIDHLFADQLPLKQAGNHLGYDGVMVWESDDVAGPSSAFVWQTDRVRELTPEEVEAVLTHHTTATFGDEGAGESVRDRPKTDGASA